METHRTISKHMGFQHLELLWQGDRISVLEISTRRNLYAVLIRGLGNVIPILGDWGRGGASLKRLHLFYRGMLSESEKLQVAGIRMLANEKIFVMGDDVGTSDWGVSVQVKGFSSRIFSNQTVSVARLDTEEY